MVLVAVLLHAAVEAKSASSTTAGLFLVILFFPQSVTDECWNKEELRGFCFCFDCERLRVRFQNWRSLWVRIPVGGLEAARAGFFVYMCFFVAVERRSGCKYCVVPVKLL